jgi:hypothetical protein
MLDPTGVNIILYTGPQCHLCELAQDVLRQSKQYENLTVTIKNIREDTELYHRYAVRIPVLQREDNQLELGWPFDLAQLETFLA